MHVAPKPPDRNFRASCALLTGRQPCPPRRAVGPGRPAEWGDLQRGRAAPRKGEPRAPTGRAPARTHRSAREGTPLGTPPGSLTAPRVWSDLGPHRRRRGVWGLEITAFHGAGGGQSPRPRAGRSGGRGLPGDTRAGQTCLCPGLSTAASLEMAYHRGLELGFGTWGQLASPLCPSLTLSVDEDDHRTHVTGVAVG